MVFNMYMELPIGVNAPTGGKRYYVLKLNKSLYGLNQASAKWFDTLKAGLNSRDFEQSQVYPCAFLRKYAIFLVYVDDCIIFSKGLQTIEDLVICLKIGSENFLLTDEGDIEHYLGVDIRPLKCDTFELCKPYMIKKVLDLLDSPYSVKGHSRSENKKLLYQDENGPSRKHSWHYQYADGMLSYLQGSNRPDVSIAVNQCARFSNDPRLIHEMDVRNIGKYFSETDTRGIIYDPNKTQGIECYVDIDFSGGWYRDYGQRAENILSIPG